MLDELECIAPVMAAWGDDDVAADLLGDSRMMKGNAISLDHSTGVTLWLVHEKPRFGLINLDGERCPLPDSEIPPDVVIFGHDHQAAILRYRDLLLVNPGSPTLPEYIAELGTVGILTVKSGEIEARIVPLG